jgi:large subunit ribosomal protein L32
MPNPKRKHSRSRKLKKLAGKGLTKPNLVECPQCRHLKLPHRLCMFCGHYAGREVVEVEEK